MYAKQTIEHVTLSNKLRRALWNVVRVVLFRPFGTKVFRPWRIALLKLFGAEAAWNAEVYASAKVWAPWQLTLGKNSCIGPHTIVYNQARVTLESDACLSQYAYVCTAGHMTGVTNNARTGLVISPVTIGKSAWVGTRAFVNMGVMIGEGAVVSACACVVKDVEPHTVVGGNPAVLIKTLNN
jgi:putative colanic acid biosynthesis acetyltransferase WcaF